MCNKEHLIGYLYGELAPAERRAFDMHVAECAECRQEVEALGETRQHLATWAPPEPALDFAVVRRPPPDVAPRPRLLAFVPQWGLAAAAALLVVAGAAAIANVEVRYGRDGVVVRTGWSAPPAGPGEGTAAPSASPAPAAPAVASSEQLKADVLALERRLRELEQSQSSQLARVAVAARPGLTVPELRRILAESEARQRTEIALQVGQVWKDFNAARANDAAYFQRTLGQAQGLTNYQLRQHRDSIDSLYRVSASQQK